MISRGPGVFAHTGKRIAAITIGAGVLRIEPDHFREILDSAGVLSAAITCQASTVVSCWIARAELKGAVVIRQRPVVVSERVLETTPSEIRLVVRLEPNRFGV